MDQPLRILVFGEGISLAHVSRAFMVARALQLRGAQVRFVTSADHLPWARQRGVEATAVYTPPAEKVYARLRAMQPMYTRAEIERSVRGDLEAIEAFEPSVVVGDCRNSLRIASEVSGVRYVAISNANCTPWFAGVMNAPAALPLSRLVGKQRVDRHVMPWLGRPIRSVACRLMNKPFAQAQRIFRVARPCRDFRVMFTSSHLHLLADLPAFQPTQNLPAHVRYVGPLFWGHDDQHATATDELLARVDRTQPMVYLSMGSSGRKDLLEAAAPVLAELPYQFVVTAGASSDGVPAWGPNVHVLPFVSAPRVLARAAAVVCHGGNGTVYQALSQGVPIVAIPSFFDQEIQADQLTHHGLGLRLEPGEAVDRLPAALETVLNDPAYRQRLKQWQGWMQGWRADETAAEMIEQFAIGEVAGSSPAVAPAGQV